MIPATELRKQCYDWLYEYGTTFNDVFKSMRIEYEPAVNEVLSRLGLEKDERDILIQDILIFTKRNSSIPYHQLSPLNQFFMAGYWYVLYRLQDNMTVWEQMENDPDPKFYQMFLDCRNEVAKRVGGVLSRNKFKIIMELAALIASLILFPILIVLRTLLGIILFPIFIVSYAIHAVIHRSGEKRGC